MTTPGIFASPYANSPDAFLSAPSGQGDGPRVIVRTATIPASTTAGTVVGLVPFNKGASLQYGSAVNYDVLDSGTVVQAAFGYVYDADTVFTNDPDAFNAANDIANTGGVQRPTSTVGATFVAEADGWLAVTLSGSATDTAGNITFNGTITYQV